MCIQLTMGGAKKGEKLSGQQIDHLYSIPNKSFLQNRQNYFFYNRGQRDGFAT